MFTDLLLLYPLLLLLWLCDASIVLCVHICIVCNVVTSRRLDSFSNFILQVFPIGITVHACASDLPSKLPSSSKPSYSGASPRM